MRIGYLKGEHRSSLSAFGESENRGLLKWPSPSVYEFPGALLMLIKKFKNFLDKMDDGRQSECLKKAILYDRICGKHVRTATHVPEAMDKAVRCKIYLFTTT
ncbi:hypothetical protein CDAR_422061 [Caerostris darwini]|uniref:Uncharacterized protein n=1 Tax=Caerostris darwini TaxID=1538125 RepID=A0AAV4WVE7_9ARAC|nr:hypothetical protein CDAR_422061 [Caerostris darwini]